MAPFHSYCRKQQMKLLSSKFVYHSPKALPKIKKVVVAALPRARGLNMAAATLMTSFGQKPSFIKEKIARSSEFRLKEVFVSQTGVKTLWSLQTLLHCFFPYQKENEPLFVTASQNKVLSWSLPDCRGSTQIDPISLNYSVDENSFDLVCSIQHEALSFPEAIFLLRLARVPVQLR